jgi:hypothetical protein
MARADLAQRPQTIQRTGCLVQSSVFQSGRSLVGDLDRALIVPKAPLVARDQREHS